MLTVTLSLVPYDPAHKSRSRLALISNPTRNIVQVISFTEHSHPHRSLTFPYAVFLGLIEPKSQEVAISVAFSIIHSNLFHTEASGRQYSRKPSGKLPT